MQSLRSPRPRAISVLFTVLALALAGCGGSPKQAGDSEKFDVSLDGSSGYYEGEEDEDAPRRRKPKEGEAPEESGPAELSRLNREQRKQIEVALSRGDRKAANCSSVVPDMPGGEGEVRVVFDGKIGKSVDAIVGAPWAGTDAEACIKNSYKNEIIVPFPGPRIEVPHKVTIAAGKGEGAP